jgi:ribosomal RNA assembly protein
MIVRELAKDENLKEEDWSRFLPQFQKKNVPRKKPHKVRAKKAYTPFPEPQQPSKIDLQLETGEYFASEHQRKRKQLHDKVESAKVKSAEKRQARAAASETPVAKKDKSKKQSLVEDETPIEERLKRKLKKATAAADGSANDLSDFVDSGNKPKKARKD